MTEPLINLLRQLEQVVISLDAQQYTQNPVGVVTSSVGGHVRHCLDHVRALLDATRTGRLDYDHRQRGTPVENCRISAASTIDDLIRELEVLGPDAPSQELIVSVTLCADDEPVEVHSTVGRELAYVLAHTIHHNALVGAMVRTLGGWLPDRFGYAPATVKHQQAKKERLACAR